jgi:Flp pilus assembly CpaE family ATPase
MDQSLTSLLVISDDEALSSEIEAIFTPQDGFRVTVRNSTVSRLNGSAHPLANQHDVVVFTADTEDPNEIEAIRALSKTRAANSILFALTDDDLPLSKARQLSRCGVDDVVPRSAVTKDLMELVDDWESRRDSRLPALWAGPVKQGKVITVAQARGGVGSTTVAVNLADQLLETTGFRHKTNRNSVIVVDLDFQFGTVGSLLDVGESDGLLQLAVDGFIPQRDYIEQCVTKLKSGLAVLPAPTRFGPLESLKSEQVAAIIDTLRSSYDYVIVDLPRALVGWLDPILAKSDEMMLVTDVTVPSVRAARRLIDFFLAEHPSLDIEIVVNFEKKPVISASHHREAARILERDFRHWLPRNERAARETLDRGQPLSAVAPRSDLARSIRRLARGTIEKLTRVERP